MEENEVIRPVRRSLSNMSDGGFSACQGASNWIPLEASRGALLVMVGLATVALESSIASPVFVPARTGRGHIKEYSEDIWEKSRARLTVSEYFLLSHDTSPSLSCPNCQHLLSRRAKSGLDHGVGHPGYLCTMPQHFSTGGKSMRGL